MKQTEVNRFNTLYERHLRLLKLQGKAQKTIDAYSRSVRRIRDHFDCSPDTLTLDQLEAYFGELVETHSWSRQPCSPGLIRCQVLWVRLFVIVCFHLVLDIPHPAFLPFVIKSFKMKFSVYA